MLKIWLTCLQPSLGILGTALVLSYPQYSQAAPKPVVAGKINKAKVNKVPVPVSQWSTTRSSGTTIDSELSSSLSIVPDMAVRQLAMGSMATSGIQTKIAPKKALPSKQNALAKFGTPASAGFPNLSAKATKPQNVKNDVAEALARANKVQAPVPVPGLYIGTSDVRVSAKVLPTAKPLAQAIASSQIGAPTPLSAMMAAQTAVDPFPVVRPEMMQKLDRQNTASISTIPKATTSLDPIATIPTAPSQAVAPKATASVSQAPEYHSLDPIAAIPSGLQRLLGNNLNSESTTATVPVAKTTTNPNEMVALGRFVSPTGEEAPTPITAASLQLATAQAYSSVPPKFSIPGETMLTAKSVKPSTDALVVNRVQKNSTATAPTRKSKYVAILNDRQLTPTPKQPWMLVDRPTNLGGLILGSQAPAAMPRMVGIGLIPLTAQKNSAGLPARSVLGIN
jgi:hypothetical protein